MYQKIENYLFEEGGTHALSQVRLISNELELTITPWSNLNEKKTFFFKQVRKLKVELEELQTVSENLPMNIIGVVCKELPENQWSFDFHCEEGYIDFESLWPVKSG